MTTLTAVKTRNQFAEVINRVAYGNERVIITRRGKDLAAIIPVEDLELLQALEDKQDLSDAREAIKEAKRKGTKPWSKIKSERDL